MTTGYLVPEFNAKPKDRVRCRYTGRVGTVERVTGHVLSYRYAIVTWDTPRPGQPPTSKIWLGDLEAVQTSPTPEEKR